MKRFDVIVMFVCLWLLASMVLDVLTPNELTVYAIGAALAPATLISALLHWFGVPKIDFAVCFSVLWMISGMALELISPQPLSPYMMLVAVLPIVIVGIVINFLYWRGAFAAVVPEATRPVRASPENDIS